MEKRGIPTVIVVTDAFLEFASALTEARGKKIPRLVVVPHPIGGLTKDKVQEKAARAVEHIVQVWVR